MVDSTEEAHMNIQNIKVGDTVTTIDGKEHIVKEIQLDLEPENGILYVQGNKQIPVANVINVGG